MKQTEGERINHCKNVKKTNNNNNNQQQPCITFNSHLLNQTQNKFHNLFIMKGSYI